jgi:hypothetical protein
MTLALSLVLLGLQAGSPAEDAASRPVTERSRPAEEFRRIGRALYDGDCASYGAEPARTIQRLLERGVIEREKRASALADLARERLEQGRVAESIALLEEALESADADGDARLQKRLHLDLGTAFLRLAEDQNCVERPGAACCVLPLAEEGLHRRRDPALAASAHFRWLLERRPQDLRARWVLNVLAVLLGEYPASVSEDQRIPLHALGEPSGTPLFRDVAASAGVDASNLAGGVVAEDFDGDGWIDLLTSTCDPLGPLLYYRSAGDGTFEDRSAAAGTASQLGGLNLIAADYDNDGDKDALVLRGGWLLEHGSIRNSLLRNERGATFVDVTRAAGVAEPAAPSQAALFADFDSDGWLDLYVGNESLSEMRGSSHPSQLFLGTASGTFRDATTAAGVRTDRYAKGVTAGDYDADGDMDLYVSNIGANRLYRNDGAGRFTDVAAAAGVEQPDGRSFATWFFDHDNDGRLDLWVGGYGGTIADLAADALGREHSAVLPCLYRNRGDGTFQDIAAEVGLARAMLPMGANFGDVDNDGWLDICLATGDPQLLSLMPNLVFRNVGGVRFEDVTATSGLGHLQKGHGIAFADFDRDGDQDVFQQLGGFVPADRFRNALFENRGGGGHWLALELVGTRANRDAIGARIRVVVDTPAGPRELHRAVGSVSSFGGSPLRQEIGLGDALRVERIEVFWPGARRAQVFEHVSIDARYTVREGAPELEPIELRGSG